jgi:hypothetical protein
MLLKHLVIFVVEMVGAYEITYIPREKTFCLPFSIFRC